MKSFLFNDEEVKYLKEIIPGKTSDKIALDFNAKFNREITMKQIQRFKKYHKIRSGVVTQWGHGQVNRYKLPPGQCVPNGEQTRFKEGNHPHNTQPVGTVLMKSDGYIYKKIAETKPSRFGWKQLHRLIWEDAHGPVPKNMCLIFLNQNKNDVRLDNLALITRAENVRMNRLNLFSEDPEITKAGLNIARIIIQIANVKRRSDKQ